MAREMTRCDADKTAWRQIAANLPMKIRARYEIAYECTQATPMIAMLSVHPSRIQDLSTADTIRIDSPIATNIYRDGFGNACHVIHAPVGRIMLSTDFLIREHGKPDEVNPNTEQHPS